MCVPRGVRVSLSLVTVCVLVFVSEGTDVGSELVVRWNALHTERKAAPEDQPPCGPLPVATAYLTRSHQP
jgi:hypothetical protein